MNNETKTLIILTPGFPANEADTNCIPARQIFVKALKEMDPSLNIIVLAFQYPYVQKKYKWHGVDVISFNGRNKGKLRRAMVWLHVWQTLKKIKKENNVTGILNFWLGECALLGKYFARRNDIKQFTWLLGQDAKKGNRYFSFIKPKADTLIAVSDFVAHEFFKNYGIKPFRVIPVGIDVSMFGGKLQKRDIDIMGVGSLIPLKQYSVFIEIIKVLANYFPNINAVICGNGPEKQKLLAEVKSQNLQNNISMTGELPHQEVLALMQRAKIFLHTANYEGFGTVHAEALYAGAHVVSFTKPMHISFEHYHVLNSKHEMAKKIIELFKDNDLNHDRVLMYSSDDIAHKVIKLFSGEGSAK